jgi:hypothetical protein
MKCFFNIPAARAVLAAAALLPLVAAAQGGSRPGPPAESIAACQSLTSAQACSFTSPKGAEKGVCVQDDGGQPLHCRPQRNGPPPEALAACSGKALGAACTAVVPEGTSQGQCVQRDAGSPMACRPAPRTPDRKG